jgi:hypothetical protein
VHQYLLRRLDKPLAWLAVFGGAGLFGGAVAGSEGELPGGALGGAAIIGGIAGLNGLLFGSIAWAVCKLTGGLDRPARRPDLWAQLVRCTACNWKTTPEGPVSRRDCLCPPTLCPACGASVVPFLPDCPRCHAPLMSGAGIAKDMLRLVRWPRTVGQAFKGHYCCRSCGVEFDRWGRPA